MSEIVSRRQTTAPQKAGSGFLTSLREYGMIFCLFAIVVFFQFVTDGTLLRPLNLTNLVLQNSYIVVMALGMLLVIVAGHIDLSVGRSEEHTSELQSLMRISYAVFCLKKKNATKHQENTHR